MPCPPPCASLDPAHFFSNWPLQLCCLCPLSFVLAYPLSAHHLLELLEVYRLSSLEIHLLKQKSARCSGACL